MPRFKSSSLSALVFVGVLTLFTLGTGLVSVLAAPLWQFPTNSVTIISDPPPADLLGQFSDLALLRPNLLDPDPLWRDPTFDDSGWQDTYPSARLAGSSPT